MRTTESQCHFAAWFAVTEMGGTFYTCHAKLVKEYKSYSPRLGATLVTDYETAKSSEAFLIERPFYGDNRHGWRLNRLRKGGGQADIGKMFLTAGSFFDAMRTTEDLARELNTRANWWKANDMPGEAP